MSHMNISLTYTEALDILQAIKVSIVILENDKNKEPDRIERYRKLNKLVKDAARLSIKV